MQNRLSVRSRPRSRNWVKCIALRSADWTGYSASDLIGMLVFMAGIPPGYRTASPLYFIPRSPIIQSEQKLSVLIFLSILFYPSGLASSQLLLV